MVSQHSIDVARKAQVIYEERLRAKLEATNLDDFVAIEPESGDYFLGQTLGRGGADGVGFLPDAALFISCLIGCSIRT